METIFDYIYYAILLAAIACGIRTALYGYAAFTSETLQVRGHSQIMAALMFVVTIAMFILLIAFRNIYIEPLTC